MGNAVSGGPPTGAAGGSLSGTYPNPGVAVPVDLQSATAAAPLFGAGESSDTTNRAELRANGTLAMGPGGSTAPDTTMSRQAAGVMQFPSGGIKVSGAVDVVTVGQGLKVATGANAKMGTGILSSGSAVVANTSVTASSLIFITDTGSGGAASLGSLSVSAISAGVGFTVTSSLVTDASTFNYLIMEPG